MKRTKLIGLLVILGILILIGLIIFLTKHQEKTNINNDIISGYDLKCEKSYE